MSRSSWRSVPLAVATDLEHGGRWSSLRAADREWLWTNPDRAVQALRHQVRPGDAFVDAGGVEEALPAVRGHFDHGDVWARPWTGRDGSGVSEAECSLFSVGDVVRGRVRRSLTTVGDAVEADYLINGPAGASFVHAVHALLEVSPDARIEPVGGFEAVVLDQPGAGYEQPVAWPAGLDRLGPDDGTATCVLLRGCRGVHLVDGSERLTMTWSADGSESCSLLFWRNLVGWPAPCPTGRSASSPWSGARSIPLRRSPRTW